MVGETNQQLVYFLAWESLAERERKWSTFMSDPEWLADPDGKAIQVARECPHDLHKDTAES